MDVDILAGKPAGQIVRAFRRQAHKRLREIAALDDQRGRHIKAPEVAGHPLYGPLNPCIEAVVHPHFSPVCLPVVILLEKHQCLCNTDSSLHAFSRTTASCISLGRLQR